MNLGTFIQQQWAAITAAPAAFAVLGLLIAGLSISATRIWLGHALEAARERLAAANDEVRRLQGLKQQLELRVDEHSAAIADLRTALDKVPRFHISDRPPGPDDVMREGDVWYQVAPDELRNPAKHT